MASPPSSPGRKEKQQPDQPGRFARASRRAHAEQERLTHKVNDARTRLEAARPRSAIVDATFRAYEHDVSTGGVVLAGAVAFRIFLFLVPLVFVLVVGLGYAAEVAKESPSSLARQAGVTGLVAKAVSGGADLAGVERITTMIVGALALFLAARGLIKVLRVVNGMVWGVRPTKPKSLSKQALVLILVTALALAVAGAVGRLRRDSFVEGIVGIVVTAVVPFGMWLFASWYLPRRATRLQQVVPGAAVFALGALFLHVVTVYFIAREVESKTDTYGAIGAALALLLWAYLLGRIMTAAAVVNASLFERSTEQGSRTSPTGPAP